MFGLSMPVLVIIIAIGAVIALAVASRFKAAMFVFGAMLMTASLAAPIDWLGHPVQTWMTAVQSRRSELFAACGLLLVISLVLNVAKVKMAQIPLQGLCLVAVGYYAGFVRMVAGGDSIDGMYSIILATVTLLPGVILARTLIEGREDVIAMLRVIAFMSAAWIACCAVQFVIRAKVLYIAGGGRRFQGMLSNPQHAGVLLACLTAACFFLLVNDRKYVYRPIWALLSGTNVALLLWTQSRTGFAMLIIMSMAIFYARLGSAILFLPIAGLFFAGVASIIGINIGEVGFERLSAGGDTRSKVWDAMWQQFLDRPMFGAGSQQEAVASENSFILGLAAYGFFMGVLMLILVIVSGFQVLNLLRVRAYFEPSERRIAELYLGFVGAYFAGSMLEGYIVSRVSAPLVLMIIFSGIGGWLVSLGRQRQHEALHGEAPALSDSWTGDVDHETPIEAADEYAGYGDASFHSALSDSRQRTLHDSRRHSDHG